MASFDKKIVSRCSATNLFVSDEYDQNSVLVRTCEASVAVNKCEGACASSIQPSALSTHGFQKVCLDLALSTPKGLTLRLRFATYMDSISFA